MFVIMDLFYKESKKISSGLDYKASERGTIAPEPSLEWQNTNLLGKNESKSVACSVPKMFILLCTTSFASTYDTNDLRGLRWNGKL